MTFFPRALSGAATRRVATIAIFAATATLAATSAFAQAASCSDITGMLNQRKSIAAKISTSSEGKKKQIDARFACTAFGQLVANGQSILKFAEANKDWCQIPDGFVEGLKTDHGKAVTIRARACSAAAKQAQMEKQAREGGGGGLLGGNGLAGQSRMPQGAL